MPEGINDGNPKALKTFRIFLSEGIEASRQDALLVAKKRRMVSIYMNVGSLHSGCSLQFILS